MILDGIEERLVHGVAARTTTGASKKKRGIQQGSHLMHGSTAYFPHSTNMASTPVLRLGVGLQVRVDVELSHREVVHSVVLVGVGRAHRKVEQVGVEWLRTITEDGRHFGQPQETPSHLSSPNDKETKQRTK